MEYFFAWIGGIPTLLGLFFIADYLEPILKFFGAAFGIIIFFSILYEIDNRCTRDFRAKKWEKKDKDEYRGMW